MRLGERGWGGKGIDVKYEEADIGVQCRISCMGMSLPLRWRGGVVDGQGREVRTMGQDGGFVGGGRGKGMGADGSDYPDKFRGRGVGEAVD